jgi:hypothetical protein
MKYKYIFAVFTADQVSHVLSYSNHKADDRISLQSRLKDKPTIEDEEEILFRSLCTQILV